MILTINKPSLKALHSFHRFVFERMEAEFFLGQERLFLYTVDWFSIQDVGSVATLVTTYGNILIVYVCCFPLLPTQFCVKLKLSFLFLIATCIALYRSLFTLPSWFVGLCAYLHTDTGILLNFLLRSCEEIYLRANVDIYFQATDLFGKPCYCMCGVFMFPFM